MTSRDVVISNRLGLHARAAAKFVHAATRYVSQIRVSHAGQSMDGKSIMGILLLAAGFGATIAISADGSDEIEAVGELLRLVDTGFGEETWSA